jgi:uncharacterized membrane protein required for colicin V production
VAFLGISVFDLLTIFVLLAFFVAGYIQGTIRRLLGIASILFSFLLAAQLREPFGNYLAGEWAHLPPEYSVMLGFGFVFVVGALVSTILIQALYDKVVISERYEVVDDILGGALGVLQALIIIAVMITILDSYFLNDTLGPFANELPFLRNLFETYDPSATAAFMRSTLIPLLLAIFGPLIPDSLREDLPSAS